MIDRFKVFYQARIDLTRPKYIWIGLELGVFFVTICIWEKNTSLQNYFFILGSVFSIIKCVPKLKTVLTYWS